MTRALLSLGSNLGDRGAALRAACHSLDERGIRVIARSPVLETEPIGGPPGQGPYLNQVIEILTDLDARALLEACQEIEAAHGRRRRERWGARTLDIDILTFGIEGISDPDLKVPHASLTTRWFVAALSHVARAPEVGDAALAAMIREGIISPATRRPGGPLPRAPEAERMPLERLLDQLAEDRADR